MLPYHSHISNVILALFFVLLVGYGYFEARGILYGPKITIPTDTPLVHDPFITLRGTAERIVEMRLNGSVVAVTEQGLFEEPYVLIPGYNRLVLEAKDTYGDTDKKVIEIMYEPLTITPAQEQQEQ
ncbi:MAG TPA: hypothetical protein VJH33_03665 [Candidatus Paceibacterota bacterium]